MPASRPVRQRFVERLLRSREPSVRWRTRVRVLGERRSSPAIRRLEDEVRRSPRARALLRRGDAFDANHPARIYRYWQGLHWALTSLADLGYPPDEPSVAPLVRQAVDVWTAPRYERLLSAAESTPGSARFGVPVIAGKPRRCASIQGNALLYATELGFVDEKVDRLAELLGRWQWPDGGWNCARGPTAHVSSFMETLVPMQALATYAQRTGNVRARARAGRAGEVFLRRRLFRRVHGGAVMRRDFVRLHYPRYWHYDALGGLRGVAAAGRVRDPRAAEALDWLEDRELVRGGWPADGRYYRVARSEAPSAEFVDWGRPDRRRANEWVSTDALAVLASADRLAL